MPRNPRTGRVVGLLPARGLLIARARPEDVPPARSPGGRRKGEYRPDRVWTAAEVRRLRVELGRKLTREVAADYGTNSHALTSVCHRHGIPLGELQDRVKLNLKAAVVVRVDEAARKTYGTVEAACTALGVCRRRYGRYRAELRRLEGVEAWPDLRFGRPYALANKAHLIAAMRARGATYDEIIARFGGSFRGIRSLLAKVAARMEAEGAIGSEFTERFTKRLARWRLGYDAIQEMRIANGLPPREWWRHRRKAVVFPRSAPVDDNADPADVPAERLRTWEGSV